MTHIKLYLVTLSGMGDTEIKVVDEDTWNWIMTGKSYTDEMVERFAKDMRCSGDTEAEGKRSALTTLDGPWIDGDQERAVAARPRPTAGTDGIWYEMGDALPIISAINFDDTYDGVLF